VCLGQLFIVLCFLFLADVFFVVAILVTYVPVTSVCVCLCIYMKGGLIAKTYQK
jgi:hypothetical protein